MKLNNLKIAPKLGILVGITLLGLCIAGVLAGYLMQREMLNARVEQAHAIVEMARVLRPGGELRGTATVTGAGPVSAACIAIFKHANQFACVGKAEDIERWLAAAGIESQVRRRGAYVVFNGKKAVS